MKISTGIIGFTETKVLEGFTRGREKGEKKGKET